MTRDNESTNESTLTITSADYAELKSRFSAAVRWLECEFAHQWSDGNTAVTFHVTMKSRIMPIDEVRTRMMFGV